MVSRSILFLAGVGAAAASCVPRPSSTDTAWATSYTATGTADVAAAKATAKTSSPTSHVKGKAFDRFVIIWNENTDYEKAKGDRESTFLIHIP